MLFTAVQDLRAALDEANPVFLLIDPMQGEPLPQAKWSLDAAERQTQRETAWQRPVARVELAEQTALSHCQHPYLVELQGLSDPWLDTSVELAHDERTTALALGLDSDSTSARRIGGWLQSSLLPHQLAQALVPMCKLNTEVFTHATYLRLADPRMFALLRHVVGDARLSDVFGHVRRWAYLDAQGRIDVLNNPRTHADEHQHRLLLSREEFRHVAQGDAVHDTLTLWLGEATQTSDATLHHRPAPDLYGPLFKALTSAWQAAKLWPHRFTRPRDQAVWAALSLLHLELSDLQALPQGLRTLLDDTGTPDDPPQPLRSMHRQVRSFLAAMHTQPRQTES
jgi:hypothetical protein